MKILQGSRPGRLHIAALLALGAATSAQAGGGYFVLGYGPLAAQSAGTSTAVGLDSFAGASNPGKQWDAGDRLDLGLLLFMPHRRIERSGSDSIYDFATTSKNTHYYLPEAGFSHRISDKLAWGLALYGNGGLDTDYRGTTGVEGSNFNPGQCGNQPANFLLGCGRLGIDLAQLIAAPTLSWQVVPGQTLGIAPLIAGQRIKIYGFQAFEAVSAHPEAVTNRDYDYAFGAGVRIGWYGHITSWLDLGAAYSSRIYMQKFSRYKGLLADGGAFDIPENYSIGAALKPLANLVIGVDIQRIDFGDIKALGNGVLNSLQDPQGSPLGSRSGSGFNWRNQTNYKLAVAYTPINRLTLRAGYAYGERAQRDAGVNSVTLNIFAPNALHQVTAGFSFAVDAKNDVNFAYGRYLKGTYKGPSATAGLGVGGTESVTPHVDTIWLGWSRHL